MATEQLKDIELNVEGMTCTNCALGVKRYLEKEGVQEVNVDFASAEAKFKLSQAEKLPQLISGIERLGFSVTDKAIESAASAPKTGLSAIEKKFYISLLFTLPLLLHMVLPFHLLHNQYFQLAMALPVYLIGVWHFGRSGYFSLRSGVPNMDVLIIIGATAAFAYSLAGTILGLGGDYLFYETAASIITIVLFGNLLEHRSVKKTTSSIEALVKLQSPVAKIIVPDTHSGHETIKEVDARTIRPGQLMLVNTGDIVPTDGEIMEGEGSVDESMITGESIPVEKSSGEAAIGGTLLVAGNMRIKATAVGKQTVLSQIIEMVKNAQAKKPAIQHLADKVSAIFVPAVLAIALLTFAVSYFAFAISFQTALLNSVAVLVIACPCAMGLAVPTAVVVGIGKAAQKGVLIKGADTLERLDQVKTVVIDKTGTLTTGQFKIKRIDTFGKSKAEVKAILYNLEKHSSHPIARSIVHELAGEPDIKWQSIEEIKGQGLQAIDEEGNVYKAGTARFVEAGLVEGTLTEEANVYISENKRLVAAVTVEDELKAYAPELIAFLKSKGIEPILLSGDKQQKCEDLARKTGITKVYAQKLPQEKLQIIQHLTAQQPTAMVGDGINDAPALASATVGISLSNATQVAVQSAQVILLKGSLQSLQHAFSTGQMTISVIKQNLFWAFFYNTMAIPLAAIGLLNPMIAALAMAFSDVVVIFNSLRLKFKRS